LVISASGSGTLVPAFEVAVGFRSSGVLAELLVGVGDRVEAGQVLARLDPTDAQDQVTQAEISLRKAELDLAKLAEAVDPGDLAAAESNLASARASLTKLTALPGDYEVLSAEQNLESAQEALADLLASPSEEQIDIAEADLTLARMNLQRAQTAYDKVAHREDVGQTQQAIDLWQATTNYEKAQAEYKEALAGPEADEIADARSRVAQAQAQLDAMFEGSDPDEIASAEAKIAQAEAKMEDLLAGASATELESVQLSIAQAELNLESARRKLAETELLAPASGTVIEVGAQVGESLGTQVFLSLADLDAPRIKFWVEEADLASVSVGNRVDLVFDALPEFNYSGEIISIDPGLVTIDGTPAVQSYASVDLTAHPADLLAGMNAEVEVVAGEALNALLVPIQALRELDTNQYAVFIVEGDEELILRPVQVGMKDFVNAEILSGLEAGDVISLGVEESPSSSSTPESSTAPTAPGGMMRFLGG
jgi:HlyD family secretion protein